MLTSCKSSIIFSLQYLCFCSVLTIIFILNFHSHSIKLSCSQTHKLQSTNHNCFENIVIANNKCINGIFIDSWDYYLFLTQHQFQHINLVLTNNVCLFQIFLLCVEPFCIILAQRAMGGEYGGSTNVYLT